MYFKFSFETFSLPFFIYKHFLRFQVCISCIIFRDYSLWFQLICFVEMFYSLEYDLSWYKFCGYLKTMIILLLLWRVFYECYLDILALWDCWVFLYPCWFHSCISHLDRGVEVSTFNCGFLYFYFLFCLMVSIDTM